MAQLTLHKTYRFRIQVGDKLLNYTGELIEITNNFISFIDKFDKTLNYNINSIVEFEEINQ